MSGAQRRLATFREFLGHVREKLGLDIGFVLWDDSTVPATLAADALAIRFADEGAVAGVLRSPKLETLAHLWIAKRIDCAMATDGPCARAKNSTARANSAKPSKRKLALRALLPFLFVLARRAVALEAIPRTNATPVIRNENRRETSPITTTYERVYALWLDRTWSTPAPIARLVERHRPDAAGQAGNDLPKAAPQPGDRMLDSAAEGVRSRSTPRRTTA